jgi:hypothetical protein
MDIEVNTNEIEHSMMYLATFARSYHTFYALYEHLNVLDADTGNLFPFRSICNALLSDTTISWCKVFGTNAEKTHWKAAVSDSSNFKCVLLRDLNIGEEEFQDYWREMMNFRNNVVAHFNSSHFESGSTPSFDIAMKSSVIAHKYLCNHLSVNVNYTGALCLNEYGKQVAAVVLSKLNV